MMTPCPKHGSTSVFCKYCDAEELEEAKKFKKYDRHVAQYNVCSCLYKIKFNGSYFTHRLHT